MKVLLVAPQSGETVLGTIGGYCKKALEKLGYDLEIFDFRQSQYLKSSFGSSLKKTVKKIFHSPAYQIPLVGSLENEKMNKSLLAKTKEFRPDILLVLMGETIFPETLEKIKKSGVTTVNWFHDTVFASARKDFIQKIPRYYDYFFIIDSEDVLNYIKIEARVVKTVPLACDPEVHKKIELSEEEKKKYRSDVCFVGSIFKGFKRKEMLADVSDFDLGIWGYWTEKSPELKRCYRKQHVYGEEAVKIYNASKIVLDMPSSYPTYAPEGKAFYVTPRVFEVPACGTLLLTHATSYLSRCYEIGKEMVPYKNGKELKEIIRYYLDHPEERKLIAKKAQERAYRDHTYEKRLQEIFSIIEENG